MRSMTGYGKAEYKESGIELTVEIKSVNNRYLDVSIKSPKSFNRFESAIRAAIQSNVTRGHLDVYVSFSDKREGEKSFTADIGLAKAYVKLGADVLSAIPDIENDLTLSQILKLPDVVTEEICDDYDFLEGTVIDTVNAACEKLNTMRLVEGEKLVKDSLSRADTIEGLVANIEKRAPSVVADYREKILSRVKDFLADTKIEESKIATEVAFFADKCNIDEEITRLKSHVHQFREIIGTCGSGKKLDFLIQEFNREANTICSKSSDIELTNYGLALKCEIEKIREQIQNIE